MQTPLWVPLVVAGLGVLGTLAGGIFGVLITQRRADRRDQQAWARERERERERWRREDEARTFNDRREAYVDCYEAIRELYLFVRRVDTGAIKLDDHKMPPDWDRTAFNKWQLLKIYAPPPLAEAARVAFLNTQRWGYFAQHEHQLGDNDALWHASGNAQVELLNLIRQELKVPDEGPPGEK